MATLYLVVKEVVELFGGHSLASILDGNLHTVVMLDG